ncbi:hypothetical protein QJQ45_018532 [Haematococcus lacustris]|nr:hypothetical protein QJQ45_018532 [Haematococcus lacustris]
MAEKRRTVPRPVPEDPDSDILDRDEALQPDLTEAERNRKASGKARAARDRDNTYHGRKCKLAHLTDHLPQELWDAFLADAALPRVEACSERAVFASLLLGLLVRGLFAIHVADPVGLHGQPVYTDIPVSQAAIPGLSCRNLFLQLCRGMPGDGANTRPSAAVAAVLAAHPDLRARLEAIPRYHSDTNMVDHVGKQLEAAFRNMLTLLFAGRLKKSVSLAGAKVLLGTNVHQRRFGVRGLGGGHLPAWSKRQCTYVRRMVCGLDVSWLLEEGGVVPTAAMQAEVALQRGLLGLEEGPAVASCGAHHQRDGGSHGSLAAGYVASSTNHQPNRRLQLRHFQPRSPESELGLQIDSKSTPRSPQDSSPPPPPECGVGVGVGHFMEILSSSDDGGGAAAASGSGTRTSRWTPQQDNIFASLVVKCVADCAGNPNFNLGDLLAAEAQKHSVALGRTMSSQQALGRLDYMKRGCQAVYAYHKALSKYSGIARA